MKPIVDSTEASAGVSEPREEVAPRYTPGDVFLFVYAELAGQTYTDRYWCFDGQLVATESASGLLLVDTYWSGSGGRTFTPEQAEAKGTLTFVCNLNDVEPITDGEYHYAKSDVFNLSYQHGCYKRLVKRKGARHDRGAMMNHLHDEMKEAHGNLESAARQIARVARSMQVVEDNSDLDKVWV